MFLQRWFDEVWNQGNEAAIDVMMADDTVPNNLPATDGTRVSNKETFRQFFYALRGAIPDIHVVVENEIGQGDLVAARCVVTGTHTGEGLRYPALSKPVRFTGLVMARLRDGQIVESWNHFDFETMYQQIQ